MLNLNTICDSFFIKKFRCVNFMKQTKSLFSCFLFPWQMYPLILTLTCRILYLLPKNVLVPLFSTRVFLRSVSLDKCCLWFWRCSMQKNKILWGSVQAIVGFIHTQKYFRTLRRVFDKLSLFLRKSSK